MLTGLRSRLNTLDGTAGEGNLISVWLDHDYRDAVLIPVAAGAAPVVVELLHRMANALQVKIMLIGGTLAVGGVTPAVINTILDDADVAAWLRPALPTTRLLLGPASALGDTLNNNVNWCARLQGKTCHGLFVPLACRTLTPLLQPFLARWGGGGCYGTLCRRMRSGRRAVPANDDGSDPRQLPGCHGPSSLFGLPGLACRMCNQRGSFRPRTSGNKPMTFLDPTGLLTISIVLLATVSFGRLLGVPPLLSR